MSARRLQRGLTLFEVIAVLSVVGIALVVLIGSYPSWGTAHALTGAARIMESGLHRARALAVARNAFVIVEYGSHATNQAQTVSGFQIFINTNDNAEVAAELATWRAAGTALGLDHLLAVSPYQRLPGHVRLQNIPLDPAASAPVDSGILLFRPDGSAWSWDDQHAHYVRLLTVRRFLIAASPPRPLERILRVDLETGMVTLLQQVEQP